MARETLTEMIEVTRELLHDADAPYQYTDAQIQRALDARRGWIESWLHPVSAGKWASPTYLEDADLFDSSDAAVTPTSSDNVTGYFETADLTGVYVTAWEHDPYGAAADMLELHYGAQMAAGAYINIGSGRHSIQAQAAGDQLKGLIISYRMHSKTRPTSFDTGGGGVSY